MNSFDTTGSVELIRMNIIALHIKCRMQLVQSIYKLNEDTLQLISIVSYDFWMPNRHCLYNTPSHLSQKKL